MVIRFSVLLLILILLPFLILIALLIKINSKGNAIFKQERLGRDKIPFVLYKFRTMVRDAEIESGPIWAQENDPRVTPIGRFLRKTRLDELPQLINVIKGDMNIIGCRPIREHFYQRLEDEIEEYDRRFEIKPGLTGWAQVNEVYANTIAAQKKKFDLDLYYINNRTFLFDLKILFMTLKVPFKKMGL